MFDKIEKHTHLLPDSPEVAMQRLKLLENVISKIIQEINANDLHSQQRFQLLDRLMDELKYIRKF